MPDSFLHALRDQQLIHVAARPATAFTTHRAAFDQRLQNFLDEERITFGFAMHRNSKLAADILAEQRAELSFGFVRVETSQHEIGRASCRERVWDAVEDG